MSGPIDVVGIHREGIQRQLADATRQYKHDLDAASGRMAASGRGGSGADLIGRVDVLRNRIRILADQCFSAVERLPAGTEYTRRMHRENEGEYLRGVLCEFLNQAEGQILIGNPPPAAVTAINQQLAEIRDQLEHDLRSFQASLWRPHAAGRSASVTNNNNTVYNYGNASIQQAGDGATQSATVQFNASAVESALEKFVAALAAPEVPEQIRRDAMIEVESIRPQLRKVAPNVSIIREGLHSLRSIAEGMAGGYLLLLLAPALQAAGLM
jgi:hypothetical protein